MKIKFAVGVLAVATMLMAGVFSSTALADYPPPNGSVEFEVSDTTVDIGDDVTLTLIVLDADGNPVANALCTISVTDQPAAGAGVAQDSAETDADGAITGTLDVGDSPGNVVVTAVCPAGPDASTVLSASGTVVVAGTGGAALPPASSPSTASPPASLPSTGVSPTEGNGGTAYAQLAIAVAAAGGLLLVFGIVGKAARQRARRD